ncbi:glycoside hydrolase [Mycena olivaceomarginata]|nr:glycoside hydrolase [Mycena olivaceomarginata]
MKRPTTFALIASVFTGAAAHGWVSTVVIKNTTYTGNAPLETQPTPKDSIIRQVADNMPVSDLTLDDLICGRGATSATQVAPAAPGDNIKIGWGGYPEDRGGEWIHDVGPMLAYLAACDTSCSTFNATQATQWFKIAQQGTQSNGSWYQERLYEGLLAEVTLPANLKGGDYLLRHEVIALHMAEALGGGEFFPSCIQITVTGNGTSTATQKEMAHFPGAYKSTDPGIHLDVYTNFDGAAYPFPGPPIAAFVEGGT